MRSQRIEEAKEILRALGLPRAQCNSMSALTLLALAGVGRDGKWSDAEARSLTVTKGIMEFVRTEYRRRYAPNTRETFRRQVLHQFVQALVVEYNPDDPLLPVNSPKAHYRLSEPALKVIESFGTRKWVRALAQFRKDRAPLIEVYAAKRARRMIPVQLSDGRTVTLSAGRHNEIQAAIIKEFAPRFAPGAILLYLGDTALKALLREEERLRALGLRLDAHGKLPDVILLDEKRGWLYLVEAVASHGPVSPKRAAELRELFAPSTLALIFVTAFSDFVEFRKHVRDIAWETEVWVAEFPDHLIHYNGDRFMGPR
jgi:type II restriction enzyme